MKKAFIFALGLICAGLGACGDTADTDIPPETVTGTAAVTTSARESTETESVTTTAEKTTVTEPSAAEEDSETETSAETKTTTAARMTTKSAGTAATEVRTAAVTQDAADGESYVPVQTEAETAAQTRAPETTASETATESVKTTESQTVATEPERAPVYRSLGRFSDYTDWAQEGYDQGTLVAQGRSGINEDHYRTLPDMGAYRSGRIVIGDSRCCQMGIYEQVNGREDFAVFAVWGGHLTPGVGYQILSGENLAEIRSCFEEQVRSAGDCTVYLFATVNDYDYARNNNDANIRAVVEAARTVGALTCQTDGATVSPEVKVIGFDGCWDTADLYGIPQEDFNRYVRSFSDRLRDSLAEAGFTDYTTVMDIAGGKAGFIDDGLHYDEGTLDKVCGYVKG